ncbi:MFS transporter [Paludibaculum fermentans]|uniref:MFS transporter n=1 Tax=Paludibaculum fermentans TaxID=1473598 RepID=A0A7S7NMR4_PALFE|nr:MFS transporter [Paludibaculum fermentans]QOY86473.1 MFS transporter [Paludibaculum fermentans]
MLDLLPDLSPLKRSRDFRLLYVGQLISGFGSALTYVVLPVQMYQLTRSTAMVGLLGVAEFVPMLLVAFLGGALADRLNRRDLILGAESLMAVTIAGLTLNALLPRPHVWLLFVTAALLAALNSVHRPSMEAMTPQLFRSEEMPAVSALNSIRGTAAHILGPGIAGWIAVTYGPAAAFGIDAATYLCGIAALLAMTRKEFRGGEEGALTWHTLAEGWRYALQRKDLLGTYLIDMNAMFFGMPNALFPAFGDAFGAQNVGWLYAAGPAGALVLSLTSGWATRIRRHGLAIAWAAALWGLAIVGFGLSANLWLALLFLALAGAADMVSGIFRMTVWNQTIPARLRGRTAAIEMVSYLSGPYLGNAEAGFAARLLGLGPSVVAGGVLCVLGSALITWALPDFRKYQAPQCTP